MNTQNVKIWVQKFITFNSSKEYRGLVFLKGSDIRENSRLET